MRQSQEETMALTPKYQGILEHIKNLNTSPFTFPLSEYCSHIVDNPRCYYCDKKEKGIEGGMSPSFDNKRTKGWHVCFHICHSCNSKVFESTRKLLESLL